MKTSILLSICLLAVYVNGFSTKHTITNQGFTFSPSSVTIAFGDSVQFTLGGSHDAVEVSQATWNVNGTTALAGGFETPFGGGLVLPAKLAVGIHYYVCTAHASSGMKGTITVTSSNGIEDFQSASSMSVYPNPTYGLLTIKTNENLSGTEYLITNISGKLINKGTLDRNTTAVDISQFSPGEYYVQILGKRKQTVKLMKY
jgi:plastocyanin